MKRHSILLLVGLFVCALLPSAFAGSFEVKDIRILSIRSAITPATLDYLSSDLLKPAPGRLSIIKMNTPGGLVSTTKEIISLFSKAPHPVVVWVTPGGASAASAGSLIASGAHFIFMSPGTNMGAATPVGLSGDLTESDGRKKAMNDLSALVRSLCELRGRPSGPYVEMITEAKSFTEKEALREHLIDGIVSDEGTLLKSLNGKSWKTEKETFVLNIPDRTPVKEITPSLSQQILEVLSNPSTAYFLFLLGVALIYFELQAPGGYIAGSIGAVLLVLAAMAFQVLPLNWGALGLIFVAVVCLLLEIYVTSYGLLAIAGLSSLALGSVFLFHGESGFISVEYPVIISTFLGILTPFTFIIWYLLKDSRKAKKKENFFVPLSSEGVVMGKNGTHYQVKVRGEIWNASSDHPLISGDLIEVVSADKEQLLLKIQKKTSQGA